jgi:hypothetical protein
LSCSTRTLHHLHRRETSVESAPCEELLRYAASWLVFSSSCWRPTMVYAIFNRLASLLFADAIGLKLLWLKSW